MFKRVFCIVMDSVGCGTAPLSHLYGDEGANTIAHISEASGGIYLPILESFGYGHLTDIKGVSKTNRPIAYVMKADELSKGKDTMTGHWEMMGIQTTQPFKTFTDTGFPKELIEKLEERTGHRIIGNVAASGTEILKELGEEHIQTKAMIVYTSADSVLQIAASIDTFGLERLYECCEKARKIMSGKDSVGRIIARPFTKDKDGNYYRTPDRRDYALEPPAKTVLNVLAEKGVEVVSVGKISDIFCGCGITKAIPAHGNKEVGEGILNYKPEKDALVFANFVDFDMVYGHRNDVKGYADCLNAFDKILPDILNKVGDDDMLIITADHGCDPSTPSTDHSRENVPIIVYRKGRKAENLGTINVFYYIADRIAEFFNVPFEEKEVDAAPEVER